MHFVKLCINTWWKIGGCWPQTSISKSSGPAGKRLAFGIKCEKNFKCVQLLKRSKHTCIYTFLLGTDLCAFGFFFLLCVCVPKFWPSNSWQSSNQLLNPCPVAAFQANVLNPLALATPTPTTAVANVVVVVVVAVVCCFMTNAFVYPNIILLWLMPLLLVSMIFFPYIVRTTYIAGLYIFLASLYDISNNSVQTGCLVAWSNVSALLTSCQRGLCILIFSSRYVHQLTLPLLLNFPLPATEVFMLR